MGETIGNLLGASFAGLKVKVWLALAGVLAVVAFVVIRVADNAVEDTLDTAKEAGASGVVIAGQEQTLDQLGDANDAEKDLRAGGERSAARYDQCLQDSRRRAACERYRPVEE